jgi:peptide/nickel transport system ATP-binding protein
MTAGGPAGAGTDPVLEITGLRKEFRVPRGAGGGTLRAVAGLDLAIGKGETVGLVGESGSGKTTVARCVLRLTEPDAGRIILDGADITRLPQRRLRPLRPKVHMVFQDPYSALNPRMTVADIVAAPLRTQRARTQRARTQRARTQDARTQDARTQDARTQDARTRPAVSEGTLRARVDEILAQVGLDSAALRGRRPHELSGGQRQRVGLARSLIVRPLLLVADEPTSALDVSVQASILNLLADLQRELGFSCLLISHDLTVVEYLCDRIAVMRHGELVESGTREQILGAPAHEYTRELLAARLAVPGPG